jgi:hypothetical protein
LGDWLHLASFGGATPTLCYVVSDREPFGRRKVGVIDFVSLDFCAQLRWNQCPQFKAHVVKYLHPVADIDGADATSIADQFDLSHHQAIRKGFLGTDQSRNEIRPVPFRLDQENFERQAGPFEIVIEVFQVRPKDLKTLGSEPLCHSRREAGLGAQESRIFIEQAQHRSVAVDGEFIDACDGHRKLLWQSEMPSQPDQQENEGEENP